MVGRYLLRSEINNVRMELYTQSGAIHSGRSRKHDHEAYISVFNGIDAFVVREIALEHGGYGVPWSMSQM